jgi:hypothetical protein
LSEEIAVCYMQDNICGIYIMTTWRGKKEGFKEKIPVTTENFTNIPLFDVLQNNIAKDEQSDSVIEGMTMCSPFNMFCDDYFQNVGKLKGIPGANDAGDMVKDVLKYFTDPIKEADQFVEDSILDILKTYVNGSLQDCTKDKVIQTNKEKTIVDTSSFTWLEQFTTMKSGYIGPTDVSGTIQNLQKNHPGIDPKKLSAFYIDRLNKRYQDVSGNLTQNDLFEFNVDMDMNLLTDPAIQKKVAAVKTPEPDFKSVTFAEFLKSHSRFHLKSSAPISYYEFNDIYFPMPNMKIPSSVSSASSYSYFQSLLEKELTDTSKVATNEFKQPGNTTIPTVPPKKNSKDNWAFSLNLIKPTTDTISSYLNDMILYSSFIVVYKEKTALFREILPKIASVYLTCINTIEYLKYAKTNKFLSEYELAMFNHIFYCCLNQDSKSNNIFNNTNKNKQNNIYINIGKQTLSNHTGLSSFDQLIRSVSIIMKERTPYLSNKPSDWYSSETMITGVNDMIRTEQLPIHSSLCDYILKVNPTPDVITYYTSDFETYLKLQSCNAENAAILKQFRGYAHTIKQEMYRILTIPIVIYLVYNFYYMFLFKDCFGYAKDTSTDETKYEGECKKGCFFPPFPDWEYNFHQLENNRTDFFFEFIFKPAKCLYVFLNAIKTPFHSGILSNLPTEVPYLCFLTGFVCIYSIIYNYGGALLNSMTSLLNLEIPKLPIGEWQNSLTDIASAVVWISFIKAFINSMMGDPTAMAMNMMSSNLGIGAAAKPKFPSVGWIMDSMGSVMLMGLKTIVVLIYWVLRAAITSFIIPISIFIMIFYFFFFSIAGMFYYTDNNHSYHDKIEMMERVMYSKLYDLRDGEMGKNTFKTVCFYAVFLLTEMVVLYTLITNMKNFQNMAMPKVGGAAAITAARGIQTFMTIITTLLIVLLVLWCVFKYFTQKNVLNEKYSLNGGEQRLDNSTCNENINPSSSPDNKDINKQEYDKFYNDNKDDIAYFNENKDSFMSRIMHSDRLNPIFAKYYSAKTGHIESRPIAQTIMNKLVGIGKYVSEKINPPETYETIKPDNTGIFGPGGFMNKIKETANKVYKEDTEAWGNTTASNFFGNVDPTKMGLMDGMKKMMAIDTNTK